MILFLDPNCLDKNIPVSIRQLLLCAPDPRHLELVQVVEPIIDLPRDNLVREEFLQPSHENWQCDQLVASRSVVWPHLEQPLYHVGKVIGKILRDPLEGSFRHFAEQTLHVISHERWLQCEHLVQDAAQ